MKYFYISILFLAFTGAFSQSPFWVENFGTGCTTGALASGLNPSGMGTWTVVSTGTNDTYSNKWFVSAEERGMGIGNCGTACGGTQNRSLHIGIDIPPLSLIDLGASYGAGAGANTNYRAESPVINCTGQSDIILTFAYFLGGVAGSDYFEVQYSPNGGSTWSVIATPAMTSTTCSPQGLWTGYTVALPATANNNNNVKVGFRWQNVDNTGADPSVALDDVALSTLVFSPSFTLATPMCAGDSAIVTANTGTYTVSGYTWSAAPAGPVIATPNASATNITFPTNGTFSITLTATSGSTTQSTTNTVLVNPTPVVTPSLTSGAVCAGESVTMTVTGASTYTWNPGNLNGSSVIVTPTATTDYTVVGTSSAGCTGSAVKSVTVNSMPSLTLASSSASICSGSSATLTASGASTYTWNPGALNGSVVVVSPTVTTTYSATGTSGAGCTNTNVSTVSMSVVICTGLNSVTLNDHVFNVFPNPVSDKLFIKAGSVDPVEVSIEVVDALGKLAIRQHHTFTATASTFVMNVAGLNQGVYFVKIATGKETRVMRFIKE